jgi:hypothetical protein
MKNAVFHTLQLLSVDTYQARGLAKGAKDKEH